ncbi:MAG: hypothetical protein ACTH5D_05610 [Halomonas sp.]|uniref:hypothetical protein n=1 Tax=Halomonas sp. TaxID=1486246 RepID=UPI003F92722F
MAHNALTAAKQALKTHLMHQNRTKILTDAPKWIIEHDGALVWLANFFPAPKKIIRYNNLHHGELTHGAGNGIGLFYRW